MLDIVAGFRGALQLLPKPGFKDMFQGQSDGGGIFEYQKAETWIDFKRQGDRLLVRQRQVPARPSQRCSTAASWLWTSRRHGDARRCRPSTRRRAAYVFGVARNTPCGVREEERPRCKMVGTTRGDGTVTWESGRIGGIGQFFYMPAEHGDLPATEGILSRR